MVQRSRGSNNAEWISFVSIIVALIFAGIVIILLAKFQRGMIGIVLAIAASLLLLYWVKEFRRTVRNSLGISSPPSKKELMFDIINESTSITVVAEVPGPEDNVKVDVNGLTLNITGGMNFKKSLKMETRTEINSVTYVNGVLTVKLKKLNGT